MKKLGLVSLAAAIALSSTAALASDVKISGDWRLRGHMLSGYSGANSIGKDAENTFMDNRLRLKINAKTDGGIEIKTRITMFEDSKLDSTPSSTVKFDGDDYAYAVIPVADKLTLTAGLVPDSFGTTFASAMYVAYAAAALDYAVSDMLTIGAGVTSYSENSVVAPAAASTDVPADSDGIAVYATGMAAGLSYGAKLEITRTPSTVAGDKVDETKDNTKINVWAKGKVAGLNVAGEFETLTGDNADGSDAEGTGFFVQATKGMGKLTAGAALAVAQDGFTSSLYFTPTYLVGLAQPNAAVRNFGSAGKDATTTALVVPVSYKVSDMVTAMGKVAFISLEKMGDGGKDTDLTELDLGVKVKLSSKASYYAQFATGSLSEKIGGEDALMTVTNGITFSF